MKPVIIIAIAFVLLIPLTVFAQKDISLYENHGFSIEYPSDWEIVDTWNAIPNKVFFKSDYLGKSGVSVIYSEKYELSDLHERKFIEIGNANQIETIENDVRTACKINKKFGPCWNFELLDSKIIVIDGKQAISIKFTAVMDDQNTTIKMILLPDSFPHYWYIVAKAVGKDADFEQFEKSIQSFHLESISIKAEPIVTPKFSIPTFQIPFDSDIVLEKTMDVNLILIGETWSSSMKSSIENNLPKYRDQIFVTSQEKTGVRHIYNYNFVSVSEQEVNELSQFMKENSSRMPILGSNVIDLPIWHAYWVVANHPEWVDYDYDGNFYYNISYRLVDALAVEEYIYEKFVGSNPALTSPNSVNFAFLAMDLEDVDYLRNYSVTSEDDASGESFSSVGLMGFGGNNNMLFFDLYAAPWFDIDLQSYEYVFPPWIETLHDCNLTSCMVDLITLHTSDALQYVVLPPLLYPVKNSEKFVVDILLYKKPGTSNVLTPQTLKNYVDTEKIKKELEFLYPFSEWEINYSIEGRNAGALTYEFRKELSNTSHFVFEDIFGEEKGIQLLHTEKIKPYLISWAEEQSLVRNEKVWQIPVLIEISSREGLDVYLDNYGTLGYAPALPNSDEPCCAFGVTSEKKIWKEKIGFTDLLIHEVGHTLGLMHPFMSTNEYGDITVNQYFNWYSSPMTYSSPSSGCGTLFYLIFPDPCGNASLSFTEFERNMISDARLASIWKDTDANLKNLKGQNLDESLKILQESKNAHKKGDAYSLKGSLKLAKDAYSASQVSETTSKFLTSTPTKIPEWIKNNAKWWADGAIDDNSFKQGIQHMIKENIISISDLPKTSAVSEDKIPDWIKNNARWWADGTIDESEFVNGLKYMVEKGIIGVD